MKSLKQLSAISLLSYFAQHYDEISRDDVIMTYLRENTEICGPIDDLIHSCEIAKSLTNDAINKLCDYINMLQGPPMAIMDYYSQSDILCKRDELIEIKNRLIKSIYFFNKSIISYLHGAHKDGRENEDNEHYWSLINKFTHLYDLYFTDSGIIFGDDGYCLEAVYKPYINDFTDAFLLSLGDNLQAYYLFCTDATIYIGVNAGDIGPEYASVMTLMIKTLLAGKTYYINIFGEEELDDFTRDNYAQGILAPGEHRAKSLLRL